ncbi:MAG: hypothetical protein SFX73_33625 [Kofleriaceae bacterium]|nr:hypothetical protein [Kofleriaceae bacterium]
MNPVVPAGAYAVLTAGGVAFQLALALGAPWGKAAMGGKYPGVLPPAMRVAAVVQAVILLGLAAITLARAGVMFPALHGIAQRSIWIVVAFSGVALVLNSITPSKLERKIWAPVALGMLASSVLVAISYARSAA